MCRETPKWVVARKRFATRLKLYLAYADKSQNGVVARKRCATRLKLYLACAEKHIVFGKNGKNVENFFKTWPKYGELFQNQFGELFQPTLGKFSVKTPGAEESQNGIESHRNCSTRYTFY